MLPQALHKITFGKHCIEDIFVKMGIPKRKLVIDFSSPNIAKTFHIGNLRSTLHGNFLQKIFRKAGHDVVSINYLGDWGHQFSLLAFYWIAVKRPEASELAKMGTREKVEMLTSAYVDANNMSKRNSGFNEKSKHLFLGMEKAKLGVDNGTPEIQQAVQLWQEWRETTREYLEDFYSRFEINFDEWDGESAYVKEGADLVDELIAQGKCQRSNDNWIVENTIGPGKDKIALRHGNGANLYLNREMACIYARHRRHNADEYIYVVDRQQANHFTHLKQLLCLRGDQDLAERIHHHSYGRVIGLSTREGKNESVDHLIDQGELEAKVYVNKSVTKKSHGEEMEPLCKALAQSQVVFDLIRRNKNSDFTFSYRGAFKTEGTNALLLQQKYSRLNSLQLANIEHMNRLKELDESELARMRPEMSDVAHKLAGMIVEFDTVLKNSLVRMEPCPLSVYLVRLCNIIGSALPALRVLGEPLNIALPRLLLFSSAKKILGEGMQLIGIKPIEKI